MTSNKKILVINNNFVRLKDLDSILQRAGYDVLTAANVNEAINLPDGESPDLLITYISSSLKEQKEVEDLVKSTKSLKNLPVLMLGEDSNGGKNFADGISDYLPMPFDPLVLATKIAQLIERARMEKVIWKKNFRFRSLIENSSDITTVLTPEGIILYESPSVKQILGRESQTDKGINAFDFIHPHDRRWVIIHFRKTIPNPSASNSIEYRYQHQDGSWRILQSIGKLVEDPTKGKVIIVNSRDVTSRKTAENSLRESERKFKAQYKGYPVPTYTWRKDGDDFIFTDFNDAADQAVGGGIKSFLGQKIDVVLENSPQIVENVRKCFAERTIIKDKTHHQYSKTGEKRWIDMSYVFVPPDLVMIHTQDITENVRALEDLRMSENRFQLISQATNDALWDVNLQKDETWVNDGFYKMFGYSPENIKLGLDFWKDIVHPEDRKKVFDSIERTIEKGESFWSREYRVRCENGQYANVFDRAYITRDDDGKPLRMIGAAIDITARKKSEEAMRFQAHLLATVEQAIVAADLDGTIMYWNNFAEKLFGWTKTEAVNQNLNDLIIADASLNRAEEIMTQMRGGKSWSGEIILHRRNGNVFPAQMTASPVQDAQGKLIGMVGIAADIAELKKAEEELLSLNTQIENQRQRLDSIIANIPGAVWESTIDTSESKGKINFVSVYAETIFGYTVEEWLSEPNFWVRIIHPEDIEKLGSNFQTLIENGGTDVNQYRWVNKDGRIIWTETRTALITDKFGNPHSLRGISTDITNRKLAEEALQKSEEQLRQAQKLESVGRLAGGIAHDFNNMLTAINGYSDLILREIGANNPISDKVLEIRKAGERSAELTYQLLAFSRKQILQPKLIELNSVIGEMDQLLHRLIGEDVYLSIEFGTRESHVEADPGKLSQVIMNLVINARDAMPQGGELKIRTEKVLIENEPIAQFAAGKTGEFILLSVEDNGIGIEDSDLEQIFEPFFTTKKNGVGTGLGLSTVYGIIKQSGGFIWVDSQPKEGATFKVYLPYVGKTIGEKKEAQISEQFPRGEETILLVEDEDAVRKLTRGILELCGYKVFEVAKGSEALELYKNLNGEIDLLMTDVVMPGMSGRELAEKISVEKPELKILYTSGYMDDQIIKHGISHEEMNFIQKPFAPDILARKIRQVLNDKN